MRATSYNPPASRTTRASLPGAPVVIAGATSWRTDDDFLMSTCVCHRPKRQRTVRRSRRAARSGAALELCVGLAALMIGLASAGCAGSRSAGGARNAALRSVQHIDYDESFDRVTARTVARVMRQGNARLSALLSLHDDRPRRLHGPQALGHGRRPGERAPARVAWSQRNAPAVRALRGAMRNARPGPEGGYRNVNYSKCRQAFAQLGAINTTGLREVVNIWPIGAYPLAHFVRICEQANAVAHRRPRPSMRRGVARADNRARQRRRGTTPTPRRDSLPAAELRLALR